MNYILTQNTPFFLTKLLSTNTFLLFLFYNKTEYNKKCYFVCKINTNTMKNNSISTEWIRHAVFIVIIIGMSLLLFLNLSFFLSGFLGAFTLYMLLRKPHSFITTQWGWKPSLSSLSLLFVAFLSISAIGYGIYEMVASKISLLNSTELLTGLKTIETKINLLAGKPIIPDNIAEKSAGSILQFLSSLLSTTYSFAANFFMMLFMLFFMLTDIMTECSEVIYGGNHAKELIESAFGVKCDGMSALLKGVVSRKKQLIPTIMESLQQ